MIDTQTTPLPVEKVTPLKPSDAIRLGCIVAPVQAFGRYGDGVTTACATKALQIGYGGDVPWGQSGTPSPLGSVACPICSLVGTYNRLAHLNDDHRWSRERIADWLEGLGL